MSCFCTGLLIVVYFNILSLVECTTVKQYDICSNATGHRVYLQYGVNTIITAKNLSVDSITNKTEKHECYMEVVTCPSCVLFLNFSQMNISHRCEKGNNSVMECLCETVQITEQPYEEASSKKFCGKSDVDLRFRSQTRNVAIKLVYYQKNEHAFTVECSSQRNRLLLSGEPVFNEDTSKNILTSPFFPSYYLHDLSTEYIISCPDIMNNNCRVRLLFSDFQLAIVSVMEFFDFNGQRIDVVSGNQFRPPILISSGPSLMIRFYANSGTGLGYKAFYSFVPDKEIENRTEYNIDCGGYVDNLGGGITMMNMVDVGINRYYCFWIVRPPKTYLHSKTHLYLKVVNFSDLENSTELVIQQGSTSAGKILEVLQQSSLDKLATIPREHIQPIESGFYVSLKGAFNAKSRLAIVYTAFTYKDCFSGAEFLCENHRCIPRQLTCDGFDNCGDGSDEPSTCFGGTDPEPVDRRWYSHTPNYFFPKNDLYSDLKTATLVFIISSLGLISLMSALFVLLYRINTRSSHERVLQNHLQIITDLLEEETDDTSSAPDEPPVYEAPPDYDEIIKVDGASELAGCEQRPKPRRSRRKRRRDRRTRQQDTEESSQNTSCSIVIQSVENTNETNSSSPPNYDDLLLQVCCENNLEVPLFANIGYEDKSISSNMREILTRRWHSQSEMADEVTMIPSTSSKMKQPIYPCSSNIKITEPRRNDRETASDSELLNIESTTDDREFEGERFHLFKTERLTQLEKDLFDYFRRRSGCQCEGACSCQQTCPKYIRRKFKKIPKKKHHFYTR